MLFVYTPLGSSAYEYKKTRTPPTKQPILSGLRCPHYLEIINMALSAARRATVLADKTTLLVYKSLMSAYWANLPLGFGTIDNIFL